MRVNFIVSRELSVLSFNCRTVAKNIFALNEASNSGLIGASILCTAGYISRCTDERLCVSVLVCVCVYVCETKLHPAESRGFDE